MQIVQVDQVRWLAGNLRQEVRVGMTIVFDAPERIPGLAGLQPPLRRRSGIGAIVDVGTAVKGDYSCVRRLLVAYREPGAMPSSFKALEQGPGNALRTTPLIARVDRENSNCSDPPLARTIQCAVKGTVSQGVEFPPGKGRSSR